MGAPRVHTDRIGTTPWRGYRRSRRYCVQVPIPKGRRRSLTPYRATPTGRRPARSPVGVSVPGYGPRKPRPETPKSAPGRRPRIQLPRPACPQVICPGMGDQEPGAGPDEITPDPDPRSKAPIPDVPRWCGTPAATVSGDCYPHQPSAHKGPPTRARWVHAMGTHRPEYAPHGNL